MSWAVFVCGSQPVVVLCFVFFSLLFFSWPIIKTTAEIKFSMISSKPSKSSGSKSSGSSCWLKEGLRLSLSPKSDCRTRGEKAGCCCGDLFYLFYLFIFSFFFFSSRNADNSKWKFLSAPSQLQWSLFSSGGCNLWLKPEWINITAIGGAGSVLQQTAPLSTLSISTVGLNICLIHKVNFLLTGAKESCRQDCLQGCVTRMSKMIQLRLNKECSDILDCFILKKMWQKDVTDDMNGPQKVNRIFLLTISFNTRTRIIRNSIKASVASSKQNKDGP